MADQKIHEYPIERFVFGDDDYYDVDFWDGLVYQTAKIKGSTIKNAMLTGIAINLTAPSAFIVGGSPTDGTGTLSLTGAGLANQYIRGDGTLATLPTSGGGGNSVNYYLNGGTSASVATYYQMSKTAVIGTGVDFSLAGNGLISQWLTDVGDPNVTEIPAGNWNFEMYFSASSSGGTPAFYVELLKYDGATFTTIANNSANPESITSGTSIDLYLTSVAVPLTALAVTDRLALRVYIVNSVLGRTIINHTQDSHLCQITTTFSSGLSSINGLTAQTQYLTVGTSGTDFNIDQTLDTHIFNLPTASALDRGALSTTDWTTFNGKEDALPTKTGNSLKYLQVNVGETGLQWSAINSGITVGTTPITSGTDTRVLFQDGSTVGQDADITWNKTINKLTIGAGTYLQGGSSSLDSFATGWGLYNCGLRSTLSGAGNGIWNVSEISIGMASPSAKLDVKAGGALSTDIVQRWRNSADSANLGKVAGDGAFTFGTYTNPNTRLSISGGSITGLYCSGLGTAAYFQNETGTGTGYAAQFLGRQYGSGSPSGYNSFGILTGADTINGVNYAIKAYAHNGTTNYAGYFDATGGTTNYALYVQRGNMVFGVSPTLNKIGFWNATPIVQPTTAIASATLASIGGGSIGINDTFDGYTLRQVVKALRNSGLLA
jgi:hypothetical protein